MKMEMVFGRYAHTNALIFTGVIPDLYINNLKSTRAFSNHAAVETKPSGHARKEYT